MFRFIENILLRNKLLKHTEPQFLSINDMLLRYQNIITPVVVVDSNNVVCWINKIASKKLELFIGSRLNDLGEFKENLEQDQTVFTFKNNKQYKVEVESLSDVVNNHKTLFFDYNESLVEVSTVSEQVDVLELDSFFESYDIPFETSSNCDVNVVFKKNKKTLSSLIKFAATLSLKTDHNSINLMCENRPEKKIALLSIDRIQLNKTKLFSSLFETDSVDKELFKLWSQLEEGLKETSSNINVFDKDEKMFIRIEFFDNGCPQQASV